MRLLPCPANNLMHHLTKFMIIIKGQMDKALALAKKLHRVYRGIGTQRNFTSLKEFEEFLREKQNGINTRINT